MTVTEVLGDCDRLALASGLHGRPVLHRGEADAHWLDLVNAVARKYASQFGHPPVRVELHPEVFREMLMEAGPRVHQDHAYGRGVRVWAVTGQVRLEIAEEWRR